MCATPNFTHAIFDNNANFENLAYALFKYQYENNPLYRTYARSVNKDIDRIHKPEEIPFLPILFFKTRDVVTGSFTPEIIFESSGTTGERPGRHLVKDASVYRQSFRKAFELFYGPATDLTIIGLLPSYLERRHSSLVYMVEDLIALSGKPDSGFYLYEWEELAQRLQKLEKQRSKTLLIGVTFALLDFAEKYPMKLDHTLVMETGGMKGRREELTRDEVHDFLRRQWGTDRIHSEYGMSELLSQAYSSGEGRFRCPPWMKIFLRDETDPLHLYRPEKKEGQRGLINIIDLANIHSCAFIATDDIGRLYPDGSFEVLGRADHSDIRGCNQLVL